MGHLSSSSIIVDAVLTKQGRKLLAQGQGLNMKGFKVNDAWINYDLWNQDHPSGSDSYGDAITSYPLPEASTNARIASRFQLVNRERNLLYNPVIVVPGWEDTDIIRISGQGKAHSVTIEPQLENGTIGKGFTFSVQDSTGLTIGGYGGGVMEYGSSVIRFPKEVGVESPYAYMGTRITIGAEPTNTAFETLLTIGHPSGATDKQFRLVIDANIWKRPTDTI